MAALIDAWTLSSASTPAPHLAAALGAKTWAVARSWRLALRRARRYLCVVAHDAAVPARSRPALGAGACWRQRALGELR